MYRLIACIGLVLGLTSPLAAQATLDNTYIYDFSATGGAFNISQQPSGALFSSFTASGVLHSAPSGIHTSSDWTTGGMPGTGFVGFTLTPNSGFHLDLTSLHFDAARNANGPQDLVIRYSTDGFATFTQSPVYNPPVDMTPQTQTPVSLGLTGVTSPVQFRFYGFNSTTSAGQLFLDNIFLTGAVVPEPTSVLAVCMAAAGVTGLVIRRRRVTTVS